MKKIRWILIILKNLHDDLLGTTSVFLCVCLSLSGVVTMREREEDEYEYDNSE